MARIDGSNLDAYDAVNGDLASSVTDASGNHPMNHRLVAVLNMKIFRTVP
jgi:hypothetical protein